jgi:FAD/FMN-containing dehydrogenase
LINGQHQDDSSHCRFAPISGIEQTGQDDVAHNLKTACINVVGSDNVYDHKGDRTAASADIWNSSAVAKLVICPVSTQEVVELVKLASFHQTAVIPRGAGLSYSAGYVPDRPNCIMLDLRRMNRVVHVDPDDLYVTVETGCSWKSLHNKLQGFGLRTPQYGVASGAYSTIGGALSSNAAFLGSARYGSLSENVLSVEVVLADGSIVTTGSGIGPATTGFHRCDGPDMTGIFLDDSGAMGIKTGATLQLIPAPQAKDYLSFGYEDLESLIKAQIAIGRQGVASEVLGLDQRRNQDLAAAGLDFLHGVGASLHIGVEGFDRDIIGKYLELIRTIAMEQGGTELANTVPTMMIQGDHGDPFGDISPYIVGANGERYVPTNAILPPSKALQALSTTKAFFAEHQALMSRLGIFSSIVTMTLKTNFLIDTYLYWHDQLTPVHREYMNKDSWDRWGNRPANMQARKAVESMRHDLRDRYDALGASHAAHGRFYPYCGRLGPDAKTLLKRIKSTLDPDCVINPGSLGLTGNKHGN